jgi:CDGSH-type Zn-finger protein/truncated hemoglobin YjbI
MSHETGPSRDQISTILGGATALAGHWADGAPRLRSSVLRPLAELVPEPTAPVTVRDDGDWWAALWSLTCSATELAARPAAQAQLLEAASALQDLALRAVRAITPEADADAAVADRLAELSRVTKDAWRGIRLAHNGPYLLTGATSVTTHLGEPVQTRPNMALCRCGGSATRPWCDGTHATNGFQDGKDPKRVPDQRDTYVGSTVTVFDNRGLCQHSGFCTDRLKTVFHSDKEPFVTPSGGRLDEIVAAVRHCPSGALSFAVGGVEARQQVDQAERPEQVEVSKDGPYRITGGIPLVEEDGTPVARPAGASTEHYALCRCGQSQNKPFCSGMHWYVNFQDPPAPEEPSVFQWAGGYPAFLRLTELFYSKLVPQDALLSPLFANMRPDHPQRVASWLSEVFGGPDYYSGQFGGYHRMLSEHIGKHLTEAQRGRWAELMYQAANEVTLPNDAEFRAAFVSYVEWGTRLAVENSQSEAKPPLNMPMPHWWWVCDATPQARVSALAPVEEAKPTLAAPGEPITYAGHVKTLFRGQDRNSMKFVFDLWSYDDVRTHADAILERVRNGSMPCDGVWPREFVEQFERWIEQGKPE